MPTTTAAQRREQARAEYDAFIKGCPTNQLLDRLSELRRRVDGVSQRMLTVTLRTLERDGILTRTITPSVPVRVDYELTPLGSSLAGLLTAVKTWAETHIEEVHEARERYDTSAE